MNAPSRRTTRLLAGPVAAAIVSSALLVGAPAHAVDLPQRDCGPYLSDVDQAKDDLPVAKAALADARAVLARRIDRYEARPTKKNQRAVSKAKAAVTEAKYALSFVKYQLDTGRERVEICQGTVGATVTGPLRKDRYGYVGGDFLWNMPADVTYYQFIRTGDSLVLQGDRVFDDYDVDPAPGDDRNHVPNSRLIEDYYFGACDFLPGDTITMELWTGYTGADQEEEPAGELAWSETFDNPCT